MPELLIAPGLLDQDRGPDRAVDVGRVGLDVRRLRDACEKWATNGRGVVVLRPGAANLALRLGDDRRLGAEVASVGHLHLTEDAAQLVRRQGEVRAAG